MVTSFFPLQYLIAAVGLWLNRQQQDVIDYLKEENQISLGKSTPGLKNASGSSNSVCHWAVPSRN